MDEDTLYEERRMKELEYTEAYFLRRFSIPDCFTAWTNYKIGDKYVIELSNNDKNCTMKLEIDRDLYRKVDNIVTSCDITTLSLEDIDKELNKDNE